MGDEERGLTEEEKQARKKVDRECKRQEARDALLIMKMATDNLKNAAERRLAARQKYIEERIESIPNYDMILK